MSNPQEHVMTRLMQSISAYYAAGTEVRQALNALLGEEPDIRARKLAWLKTQPFAMSGGVIPSEILDTLDKEPA